MCVLEMDYECLTTAATVLSAIATSIMVVFTYFSLTQNQKNLNENINAQMFDKRLQQYLKIIVPYFQWFNFVEDIHEKCVAYRQGEKHILRSINHMLNNQFDRTFPIGDEYYTTYLLSIFGKDVTEAIEKIRNEYSNIDRCKVDDMRGLNVDDIEKYTKNILSLREQLGKALAKLFNVDKKTFKNGFILDTIS